MRADLKFGIRMGVISLLEVSCQDLRSPGIMDAVRAENSDLFIVTKQWKHHRVISDFSGNRYCSVLAFRCMYV